ncbi:ARL14 effector protein isoform 1-T1 [Synchiropus picturatus]
MAPAKRHAYEAQFKLQTISYAEEHGNRAAAREFDINESMVRKWRAQETELRQVKKTKRSFRGNKAKWPELEDRLEQWIVDRRAAGGSVSTVTIRLRAITLAQEMKIEEFHGGPSWCFRFMKRRQISIRAGTTVAQQRPADSKQKLAVSRSHAREKIADKLIKPNHITDMAEVPLTFDIAVTHIVEKKGTSAVAGGRGGRGGKQQSDRQNLNKSRVYDNKGRLLSNGKDMCDCLDIDCMGCFNPCPECGSRKCGVECRCDRKWLYEQVEVEGGAIIRNKFAF